VVSGRNYVPGVAAFELQVDTVVVAVLDGDVSDFESAGRFLGLARDDELVALLVKVRVPVVDVEHRQVNEGRVVLFPTKWSHVTGWPTTTTNFQHTFSSCFSRAIREFRTR
jgi:hypothetical protein